MNDPQPVDALAAEGFTLFLHEAAEIARTEGITSEYLDELGAINEMRMVAESTQEENYAYYTTGS